MVAVTAAAFLSPAAGTLAWVGARLAGVDLGAPTATSVALRLARRDIVTGS